MNTPEYREAIINTLKNKGYDVYETGTGDLLLNKQVEIGLSDSLIENLVEVHGFKLNALVAMIVEQYEYLINE